MHFRMLTNFSVIHYPTGECQTLESYKKTGWMRNADEQAIIVNVQLMAIDAFGRSVIIGSKDSPINFPYECFDIFNHISTNTKYSEWPEDHNVTSDIFNTIKHLATKNKNVEIRSFRYKTSLAHLHISSKGINANADDLVNILHDLKFVINALCIYQCREYLKATSFVGNMADVDLYHIDTDIPLNIFSLSDADHNSMFNVFNKRPLLIPENDSDQCVELKFMSMLSMYKHPYSKKSEDKKGVIIEFPSWCNAPNGGFDFDEIADFGQTSVEVMKEKMKMDALIDIVLRRDSKEYSGLKLLEYEMGPSDLYRYFSFDVASVVPSKIMSQGEKNNFDYLFMVMLAHNGLKFNPAKGF